MSLDGIEVGAEKDMREGEGDVGGGGGGGGGGRGAGDGEGEAGREGAGASGVQDYAADVRNIEAPEAPVRVKRVTWGEAQTWMLEDDRGLLSESGDEAGEGKAGWDSPRGHDAGSSWDDGWKEEGLKPPWFVAPVLVCAVLAISSAGAVMKSMGGAAPVTRAGWRVQLTALILLPGFVWQWWRMREIEKQQFLQKATVFVLVVDGLSIACHFGLWVWSLDHTSLPHSLLLVAMPPVILAAVSWLQCQPLSKGEVGGVALGVLGVVVIVFASSVQGDQEVTFAGDVASFLAAAAFALHLSAGRHLRGWMPLYVYSFPITALAAGFLALAGGLMEGWSQSESGLVSGPFNWVQQEFLLLVVYLALGPGFVGHTGVNAVLRYSSQVVVAMAITMEPVLGSLIGWALQQTPQPGPWTCIGGAVILVGTVLVNYASEKRKVQQITGKQIGDMELNHFSIEEEDVEASAEQWKEFGDQGAEQRKSLLSSSRE